MSECINHLKEKQKQINQEIETLNKEIAKIKSNLSKEDLEKLKQLEK